MINPYEASQTRQNMLAAAMRGETPEAALPATQNEIAPMPSSRGRVGKKTATPFDNGAILKAIQDHYANTTRAVKQTPTADRGGSYNPNIGYA